VERRRRRFWTWGLSIAAALVVLAATLSLSFRLVMDAVPGYRERLQSMVAQAAGHPTRIGAMALTWQRLRPSLDLRDVALLDEQGKPLLQASRLRLGFSLRRLLGADWMPGSIEIHGLALEADVDALGRWKLRGLGAGGGDSGELQRLSQLDRVRLRDCRLVVHDPQLSRQPFQVSLSDADLRQRDGRWQLSARLLPPAELAGGVSAGAELSGDPADPHSWRGEWTLQVRDIHGWPWLAGSLGAGVRLDLQQAQLRLDGRVEAGRITEVRAQGEAAAIAAIRGREILARLAPLQVEVTARPETDAWNAEVGRLSAGGARGVWNAQGHFRYAVNEQGAALDLAGDGLRLDDLVPWVALWKDLPPAAARLRQVRGDVHDLSLHYEQPVAEGQTPRYQLRSRLTGAGLAGDAAQSGFSGLDATVEADQDGGRLKLEQAGFELQLPDVFEQSLPVAALSGEFGWKHEAGAQPGWRIGAEAFDWKALGISGHGGFSLLLPDQAETPPALQLAADFAAEDVLVLKSYMPKDWGTGTREWLTRALQRGRVPKGHLQLDGPLPDYPYVEKPTGHWGLDLQVADATLAYAPDWPAAEKLQAQLAFRGHGLTISSSGAQIAGNAVDHIEAQIPDFRSARLSVDGGTHGDAAKYYGLLRNSPLSRKLASLLAQTDASGPAAVDLHLDIPLDVDDPPVHVKGRARFDGGTIKVRALDQPVTGLRGALDFDDAGVSSEGLAAQLYGGALAATIRKEPESPDGVLLAQTDAPVDAAGGLFAAYVPDWLRQRLSGTAHLNARLPFAGPRSGQLEIGSDLRGVAARLPAPAGKAAGDSLPLRITVGEGGSGKATDADALRVRIDGGERLGVALRFARSGKPPADELVTRSVEVRVGPGEMPRGDADGVFVSGAPQELVVGEWSELIDDIDAAPSAAPTVATAAAPALAFRGLDLRPQRLIYRAAALEQAHLVGRPAPDGWSVQLDGANAQGRIDFSRAGGGKVQARLLRLQLQPLGSAPPEDKAAPQEPPAPPFDPNQAPVLDLESDALKLGDADFGRFSLLTSRVAGGQTMDVFKLEGGQLQANARGTWLRRNGSSYGDLSFEISGSDLGAVLRALGYAETMDGRVNRFSGALTWPQDPKGLELAQARGTIALQVDKGVLNAVKPGAGRVLGLLNLYALPKRLLTLDFHDVTAKGLGFDHLSGTFTLADGQARTSDLVVDAPALKMQMTGRIGLAARDYDEKITVYPNVTTGVTVGATLIGGPIAGGVALLAQEVFGKPFNALSKFSYHVTGSWDNPQVHAGEKQELNKPAETAPPAAPPAVPAAPATEAPAPPADTGPDAG
jgi:uncharacterized protein (TIGR02099 family)